MPLYTFDTEPPDHLTCCITHELFEEPTTSMKTGYTYERQALIEWLEKDNRCPMTRMELTLQDVKVNPEIQKEADNWFENHVQIAQNPVEEIEKSDTLNAREVVIAMNYVSSTSILCRAHHRGQRIALQHLAKTTHEHSHAFLKSLRVNSCSNLYRQASIPYTEAQTISIDDLEPVSSWEDYAIAFSTPNADHADVICRMLSIATQNIPTINYNPKHECIDFIVSQLSNLPVSSLWRCCDTVLDHWTMRDTAITFEEHDDIGSGIALTLQQELQKHSEPCHLYPLAVWLNKTYAADAFEDMCEKGKVEDFNSSSYIKSTVQSMFGPSLVWSEGEVIEYMDTLLQIDGIEQLIKRYRPEIAKILIENPPQQIEYQTIADVLVRETMEWLEASSSEITERPFSTKIITAICKQTNSTELIKSICKNVVNGYMKVIPPCERSAETITYLHNTMDSLNISKEGDAYKEVIQEAEDGYKDIVRLGARVEMEIEELSLLSSGDDMSLEDDDEDFEI